MDNEMTTGRTRDDARHFYLRDFDGHPIGVVAIVHIDGRELDRMHPPDVRLGVSLCSKRDQFSRPIGQAIAFGRARHDECGWYAGRGYGPSVRTVATGTTNYARRLDDVDWMRAEITLDRLLTRMRAPKRSAVAS